MLHKNTRNRFYFSIKFHFKTRLYCIKNKIEQNSFNTFARKANICSYLILIVGFDVKLDSEIKKVRHIRISGVQIKNRLLFALTSTRWLEISQQRTDSRWIVHRGTPGGGGEIEFLRYCRHVVNPISTLAH